MVNIALKMIELAMSIEKFAMQMVKVATKIVQYLSFPPVMLHLLIQNSNLCYSLIFHLLWYTINESKI